MKTQLIINNDTAFITSDEKIVKGDYFLCAGRIARCTGTYSLTVTSYIKCNEGDCSVESCQKIIAGIENLPSINWNGLEEEFGWVDVEKLAFKILGISFIGEDDTDMKSNVQLIKETFKKAQSLNEGKFSLEDIKQALKTGFTAGFERNKTNIQMNVFVDTYLQSLQQSKVFDIEVEMYRPNEAYQISEHWSPKIENDSIKILKKLNPV